MLDKKIIARYKAQSRALVAQMTLDEKISQMMNDAPAIERLGIPSYNWWNEALHGVARAGVATVFPQAIGLAATFDEELVEQIGGIVSTEGRAKYNESQKNGDRGIYKGLTFWSPNVNIFRDPRWGRGQETYGEDPMLSARLGAAYVGGIQGDDKAYLRAAACAKHFAVHSGPEGKRHGFNAAASEENLRETYLPAFKACVDAGVEAVMGAYNATNGEPCCASPTLIGGVLRGEWGFDGHFVSDCGAIYDIYAGHKIAANRTEAAALAVKNGCDLNCGSSYANLAEAVKLGLVTEAEIDKCVERLMTARFKLGILGERSPYDNIPIEVNDCAEHNAVSLQAAGESLVLLENDGTLPLDKEKTRRIAVIGPNAAHHDDILYGNYNGTASRLYSVYDGLREYLDGGAEVLYAPGCHLFREEEGAKRQISDALLTLENADAVVLCVGLSPKIEGEEGDAPSSDASGDRLDLELPSSQIKLMSAVFDRADALRIPVIVVNFSGGAVNLSIAKERAAALIQAWYPGARGGLALAGLIFGVFSPSGRLPVTFYKSADDLPPFEDYSMKGRTYRYFEGTPFYEFGHGLSYTKFEYGEIVRGQNEVRVTLRNVGKYDGGEVILIYDKPKTERFRKLLGFKRVFLKAGKSGEFSISI